MGKGVINIGDHFGEKLVGVDQILNKDLYAKTEVNLKRSPSDNAPVYDSIGAGKRIGEVYSYTMPKAGRNVNLYWMFYDGNGKAFYVEHIEGTLDFDALQQQGTKTVEQVVKEAREKEEKENRTFTDEVKDMVKFLVIALAIVFVVSTVVTTFIKAKVK